MATFVSFLNEFCLLDLSNFFHNYYPISNYIKNHLSNIMLFDSKTCK